jgi:choline dehydrogenase-like flavoprotein
MGSEKYSVTDAFGRLRGFENVHVVDASALPSNIGESPQGSIMAISKMIIDNLAQGLSKEILK